MKSEITSAASLSRVYDLTISSDLCLPELQPANVDAAADVVIQQGPVAEPSVSDPSDVRRYLAGGLDRIWVNIPDVMRMEITQGRLIRYHRHPGVDEDELRLFLLGSGFGAILMQRGQIVIHGNALVTQKTDGAILCIGDSGAGKSTTAIAMTQRGLKILADDVCPLDASGFVLPGMPRAKLWEETAQQLGIDTANLSRIRAADAKYNIVLGEAHCTTRQRVRAFYWLVPDDVSRVTVERIEGAEKFKVLRNNVYRTEYLRLLGLEADYLRRLAHLASETPLFKVLRPVNGFDIDSLLDSILSNDVLM